MKKLIILLLLVASSKNNFSQDSTSIFNYVDEGFSIVLSNNYKIVKSNDSNVSKILAENGNIFAFIYLLHLSDFVQKRELKYVTNYFLVIPKSNDSIILLFEYVHKEFNKKEFILNENKQRLMLNIINSVQLMDK